MWQQMVQSAVPSVLVPLLVLMRRQIAPMTVATWNMQMVVKAAVAAPVVGQRAPLATAVATASQSVPTVQTPVLAWTMTTSVWTKTRE